MSWQFRTLTNEHGNPQMFDYSQCPPVAICSDCHVPYTNVGGRKTCCDCSNLPEEQETGQTTVEITNKFGFIDHVLVENGTWQYYNGGDRPILVCPQCMSMVRENRGSGCLCDSCNHDLIIECEHDHAIGLI